MKKNPPHLTGIVVLIAILVACSCGSRNGQSGDETAQSNSAKSAPPGVDSTKVDIYLRAVEINGEMHLEMYDTKKPGCVVIDGLITDVDTGYTVTWNKAPDSKIRRIDTILPIKDSKRLFGEGAKQDRDSELWKLKIPGYATPDTVKYEIHFEAVKYKDSIHIIDPYLRVPIE